MQTKGSVERGGGELILQNGLQRRQFGYKNDTANDDYLSQDEHFPIEPPLEKIASVAEWFIFHHESLADAYVLFRPAWRGGASAAGAAVLSYELMCL